jgi:hypothetical protein
VERLIRSLDISEAEAERRIEERERHYRGSIMKSGGLNKVDRVRGFRALALGEGRSVCARWQELPARIS